MLCYRWNPGIVSERPVQVDTLPAGPRAPLNPVAVAETLKREAGQGAVLVEGWSDQAAVEALARRRTLDLHGAGIAVVPIGGITNIGKFIETLGPTGIGPRLAGLCDAAEEPYLAQALHRTGLAKDITGAESERLGFFICNVDLEDELIRALGAPAVEHILASEGELNSFRKFQDQPAQRGRATHAQLRRFLGTRARRKIRYGTLLVDALSLHCVPRPLACVLAHILDTNDQHDTTQPNHHRVLTQAVQSDRGCGALTHWGRC